MSSAGCIIVLLAACVAIGLIVVLMQWQLQSRLVALEKRTPPFWAVLQRHVSNALHHPHPESQVLDRLIEKLESLEITDEETRELEDLLKAKVEDVNEADNERERASLLLFVMPRALKERADAGALITMIRQG